MKHDWYPASGGGLIATLWMANPLKVALLGAAYTPNPDTHKLWSDISGFEIPAAGGYTAGGLLLASKTTSYDSALDRTNLVAADSEWGPGASFSANYAVVYDSSSGALWSLVDFEGPKAVSSGRFTIDWAAIGLLFVTKA